MSYPDPIHMYRRQRGAAAVELALLIPVLLVLLTAPLLLAWYFWHYTVAQKAAHDAALFLSRASLLEMRTLGPNGQVPSTLIARSIADQELAQLGLGTNVPAPSVECEYAGVPNTSFRDCSGVETPVGVKVSIVIPLTAPILPDLIGLYAGEGDGLLVKADIRMTYVGN
jgi:hypothetical protein